MNLRLNLGTLIVLVARLVAIRWIASRWIASRWITIPVTTASTATSSTTASTSTSSTSSTFVCAPAATATAITHRDETKLPAGRWGRREPRSRDMRKARHSFRSYDGNWSEPEATAIDRLCD